MVRAPGDIFSFMQSNKIGEKVALFWIAWAFVAEKAENFKLTDQIFTKGLKRQAEPRDILQKRYQQFQRRMARHLINTQEEEADRAAAEAASSAAPAADTERHALNRLSSSRGTGSQRTGSALSGAGNQGLGSVNSRQNISNSSVQNGRPAPVTTSVPIATAPTSGLGNFQIYTDCSESGNADTRAAAPPARSSSAAVPTSVRSRTASAVAPAFTIHSDAPSLRENPDWTHLSTQATIVKENTGAATVWSSGGLPQPPTQRSTSTAPATTTSARGVGVARPAAAPFSIFLDEVEPEVSVKAQITQVAPSKGRHAGPREHVGAAHDPLEHLRKEHSLPEVEPPLSHTSSKPAPQTQNPNFRESACHPAVQADENAGLQGTSKASTTLLPAATEAVVPSSATEDDGETSALATMLSSMGNLDEEDGTINTRLAMGTINSMFCSPPPERKAQKPIVGADKPIARAGGMASEALRPQAQVDMRRSRGIGSLVHAPVPQSSSIFIYRDDEQFPCRPSTSSLEYHDDQDLSIIRSSTNPHDQSVYALNTPTATLSRSLGGGSNTFTIFQD